MARARNIKPAFFQNEELCELSAYTRLLFIGIWTMADREGRLENRPKRIKMSLFPADDFDVAECLNDLARCGFITTYEADGKKVIQIDNFIKHQSPHGLEKDSLLPNKTGLYTVWERGNTGFATKNFRLLNHIETGIKLVSSGDSEPNNQDSNQLETSTKTSFETVSQPDQNPLIPDCGILNPDLLNHESKDHVDDSVHEPAPEPIKPKPEKFKSECEEIFQYWKSVMGKNSSTLFSEDRKKVILKRFQEGRTLEQVKQAIDGCFKSDFHMGREQGKPTLYNDLTQICGKNSVFERHMERAPLNTALAPNQSQGVATSAREMTPDEYALSLLHGPLQVRGGQYKQGGSQ